MKRITAIDFTRGLVMIIMALDHTRDFMHIDSLTQNPTDLNTTTPTLFFTRWITHLCAPVFVFLSGTSAYLSFKKEGNIVKSKSFLISRGAWLLLMEFTLVNFALWFDIRFRLVIFEVIAAIGFGFIVLALLLKLPSKIIGLAGVLLIFGHDLLQYIPFDNGSILKVILLPLFGTAAVPVTPHLTFFMAYPPIPWLGMMLAGYATGQLFELDPQKRKRFFLIIGTCALALFIIVRSINIYGDPSRWSVQKNNVFTLLSFINISKYPPSLLFCLVTSGIMFLILAFADGTKNKFTEIVRVYGQVPLFYFLVHLYLLHLLMLFMVFLQGFTRTEIIFEGFNFGRPKNGSGVSLAIIYLIWLSVVISLYPLCTRYGRYKANHKAKRWLRYL